MLLKHNKRNANKNHKIQAHLPIEFIEIKKPDTVEDELQ
jgi:hypothetical protein